MKKEKMVYCRGSEENGKNVIKALEAHGGNNLSGCKGELSYVFYYIKPSGVIECCDDTSDEGELVKEFYTEIQPYEYRAEKGETYWYVCMSGTVASVQSDTEVGHSIDNLRYKEGNYYAYPSACKKVADELNEKIKKIIKNSKKL